MPARYGLEAYVMLKKHAQFRGDHDEYCGNAYQKTAEDIEYDAEVVKILRAAAEAEPLIPPQDTEAFLTFLHPKA